MQKNSKQNASSKNSVPESIYLATEFGLKNDEDRFIAHSMLPAATLSKIANREFTPSKNQQKHIMEAAVTLGWNSLLLP